MNKHLRTWIDREISCLLPLVVFYLIGLELGDSHLVIFSSCSLVLSLFVVNLFFVLFSVPCNFLDCFELFT